jgi:hypothetical protein
MRPMVTQSLNTRRLVAWALTAIAATWFCSDHGLAPHAVAQGNAYGGMPGAHYLLRSDMPPGVVGTARLDRRNSVVGYYQPIEIIAPKGTQVAMAEGGTFQPLQDGPIHAGLLIGAVYRIRVAGIPNEPGEELFPTIELIDRLYPPQGEAVRFAIPIVLDDADLQDALAGNLVTRVIYLEDPQTALPVTDEPKSQRSFDVASDQDPLRIADTMGRPVAILRIGSRTPPDQPELLAEFLCGSPPLVNLSEPRSDAAVPAGEEAIIRSAHIPRDDLPTAPRYANDPSVRLAQPPPTSNTERR